MPAAFSLGLGLSVDRAGVIWSMTGVAPWFLSLAVLWQGAELKKRDYAHIVQLHRTSMSFSGDCGWPIRKFFPVYLLRRKFIRDGLRFLPLLLSLSESQGCSHWMYWPSVTFITDILPRVWTKKTLNSYSRYFLKGGKADFPKTCLTLQLNANLSVCVCVYVRM